MTVTVTQSAQVSAFRSSARSFGNVVALLRNGRHRRVRGAVALSPRPAAARLSNRLRSRSPARRVRPVNTEKAQPGRSRSSGATPRRPPHAPPHAPTSPGCATCCPATASVPGSDPAEAATSCRSRPPRSTSPRSRTWSGPAAARRSPATRTRRCTNCARHCRSGRAPRWPGSGPSSSPASAPVSSSCGWRRTRSRRRLGKGGVALRRAPGAGRTSPALRTTPPVPRPAGTSDRCR
jgi:hypothetical protein